MGWVNLLANEVDTLRRPRIFKPEATEQARHQEPPSRTGTTIPPTDPLENIFLLIGIFFGGGAGQSGWT